MLSFQPLRQFFQLRHARPGIEFPGRAQGATSFAPADPWGDVR
jgi:hypothetical protein